VPAILESSTKEASTPPPGAASGETPAEAARFTIDELANVTKVPSRTIRFYQSKGALPKPTIVGRVAYYDQSHVERLEAIATLQDRGLRIHAIRDLMAQVDKGELSIHEWLGLDERLQKPWASDQPRVVSDQELADLLGGPPRPGLLKSLTRFHLIRRDGDRYYLSSPGLLRIALKLEEAGVDLETAAGGAEILQKHMGRAARDVSEYFFRRAGDGFGRDASPQDLAAAFDALRPLGMEAVELIFAHEVTKVLRELTQTGKTAAATTRKRKK
jgi:DNA-binding transcriptional MerR regulator